MILVQVLFDGALLATGKKWVALTKSDANIKVPPFPGEALVLSGEIEWHSVDTKRLSA